MKTLMKLSAGVTVAAALAFSGQAWADGMPSGPARAYAPTYNWGGVYLGANVGWMGDDITGTFAPVFPAFQWNTSNDSTIAGFQIGIQHQMGNLVFGVEAGLKASLGDHFGTTIGGGLGAPCGFVAVVETCQGKIRDIAQIGPRLGWAQNNWMVYGTGGYARANAETRGTVLGVPFSDGNANHSGWFAGTGIEYAITPNVIFGVEYTHYEFDSALHNTAVAGDRRTVSADADAVTARLSFKLGRVEAAPLK